MVTFTFRVKQYNCQADQWSVIMHVSDYFSKIISFGLWLPAVQPCNWVGFRISLSREGAIFRDEIENYFSCSHLARRDRDYHMTIVVFRDENEITYCYSRVSRRDRDFTKSFLMVEREKMTLTRIPGIENSRWSLGWGTFVIPRRKKIMGKDNFLIFLRDDLIQIKNVFAVLGVQKMALRVSESKFRDHF